MSDEPMWWPLELSPSEQGAVDEFRDRLHAHPVTVDMDGLASADRMLSQLVREHIDTILQADRLPNISHLMIGWGNGTWRDRPVLDRMEDFLHWLPGGDIHILQHSPEGESHPWQTFAYAFMAGVDPDEEIAGTRASLRDMAQGSRYFYTDDPIEFGHLLYAFSHFGFSMDTRFSLRGSVASIHDIMEMAIEGHYNGSFKICRKTHLTEGICAAAALLDELADYRDEAQGFVSGQMEILLPMCVVLDQARRLLDAGDPAGEDSLLSELRDTLVLRSWLENHYYVAGHLVELAVLARNLGYRITVEQERAIAFIVNELNRLLPRYAARISMPLCFLQLGHYRRAITLLPELERASQQGRSLTQADLHRFTVDFDLLQPVTIEAPAAEHTNDGVYLTVTAKDGPRPEFRAVLDRYAEMARTGMHLRGALTHYRRVLPLSWPRGLHYEFLDYGSDVLQKQGSAFTGIGVELHFEGALALPFLDHGSGLRERVARRFPACAVDWQPRWWGGGRLRVLFAPGAGAADIAAGMAALIDETFAVLDDAVAAQGPRIAASA